MAKKSGLEPPFIHTTFIILKYPGKCHIFLHPTLPNHESIAKLHNQS